MSAGALAYTLEELYLTAQHAIGKQTPAAGATLDQIVQRAMDFLYNFHTWTWRLRVTTLPVLGSATSNGQVSLPANFGQMEQLIGANTGSNATDWTFQRLRPGTLLDVQLMQTFGTTTAFIAANSNRRVVAYHVIGQDQGTNTGSLPLRALLLGPLPTVTNNAALFMSYFVTAPVVSMTNSAFIMPVPAGYQDALLQLTRSFALATEEVNAGETTPNFELAKDILGIYRDRDMEALPKVPLLSEVVRDYQDVGIDFNPFLLT